MDTRSIRTPAPEVPAPTLEEAPHGCYEGWVFLGYEGVDEDGEHVEVLERVPCRRCRSRRAASP